MKANINEHYQQLLSTPADDESFVRQTFKLLEADLRTLALSALTDWSNADLNASADALFQAVGTLQRPAWGAWNGLLEALAKARRKIAREGDAASRKSLEQAATAHAILSALKQGLAPAQLVGLEPLIELTRHQGGLTLQQVLTLPIRLRNRAEHDNWSDPRLWIQAATALRPLVRLLANDWPFAALSDASLHPEPFFLARDGQWWVFNGIVETGAIFASPNGASMVSPEGLAAVLLLLQRVLGRTAEQEESFRRWLGKLAPEDVKGVLLGDFLVGRPVGRGGFATVHKGVQLSTGRQVAVKILNDGLPEDAKLRFQQEAAFLARCDHAHVVGVLGYGEAPWSAPRAYSLDGEPWYAEFNRSSQVKTFIALEWIDGHTLDDIIKGAVEPAPNPFRKLDWFLGAAQALVNVHANGLIHRDVKPSNLMVTEAGPIMLMDFGIARTQAEDRTIMTATGQGLGTPAYMAPEQIRAEDAALEVGPAADIYGLCATFYEVFTGSRLFHHDRETAETVKTNKLAGQLPPAPRTLAPGLEWELETILLGGLQPEVADRYRNAEALVRDLNHVRNDEPIEYRRPSLARRIRLTYRRNRTVLNTAGAFCTLIVVLTAWYLVDVTAQRNRAESYQLVKTAELLATQKAQALLPSVLLATEAMKLLPTFAADQVLYRSLSRIGPRPVVERAYDQLFEQLILSPGGKYIVQLNLEGPGKVIETLGGKEVINLPPSPRSDAKTAIWKVSFNADNTRVAGKASHGEWSAVWELPGGTELFRTPSDQHGITAIALSADGRYLATGHVHGQVVVWDIAARNAMLSFSHVDAPYSRGDAPYNITFSPDGRYLAVTSSQGTGKVQSSDDRVRIWDLTHDRESAQVQHAGVISRMTFSPKGDYLAVTSHSRDIEDVDKTIDVWEVSTGKSVSRITHEREVKSIAFTPNSKFLLTGSADDTARLWRVATGEEILRFNHGSTVESAAFVGTSDDTELPLLITAGNRGTVKVWDRDVPTQELLQLEEDNDFIAFAENVETGYLTTVSQDLRANAATGPGNYRNVVRVWALQDIQAALPLLHEHPVASVRFSPDGQRLATIDSKIADSDLRGRVTDNGSGNVNLWSASSRKRLNRVSHEGMATVIEYESSGKYIASGSFDGTLYVWDSDSGSEQARLHDQHPVIDVAFSPDGTRLAAATGMPTGKGSTLLWDWRTGQEIWRLQGEAFSDLDFSSDGKYVATGGGGAVHVLNAADGHEIKRIELPNIVSELSFSPNGRYLAAASRWMGEGQAGESKLTLWNLEGWRPILEETQDCLTVVFSPDSRYLASADSGSVIRIREIPGGRQIATMTQGEAPTSVAEIVFSSDSRYLATALERSVSIWRVSDGKEVARREHEGQKPIWELAFSPDGKYLATAGNDGRAYLWLWRPEDLVADACARLPRNLTHRAWHDYVGDDAPYRVTCPNLRVPED